MTRPGELPAHPVHTVNNAAVTAAGLLYGDGDLGRTICLTVMGGLDTDCTGATAGSAVGAMLGASALPARWTEPLGDTIETYLRAEGGLFSVADVVLRFARLALS